ncbi:MAG: hypothetical protein J0653_08045, partial [Deltaproteobacteria bacterium]|nr:hypothetical protein [Deltaproteobacteria bacterium]
MKNKKPMSFKNSVPAIPLSFEQQIRNFAKTLAAETPSYSVGMERVEGAVLNFVLERERSRCFLHSLFDVKREMKSMFQGVNRDAQILVIFGLGLGHAVEYAGENLPNLEKVYVVEPSSAVLTTLLRQPEVVRRLS